MIRLATVLVVAALFIFPTGAQAKKSINTKIDMAKYTCGELLAESEDETGTVLIWIDGYLSGKTGDTTIDLKFLEELGTAVGQACKDSPNSKLLNVVEKLTK
jgi:acid stress chaperone HdeB